MRYSFVDSNQPAYVWTHPSHLTEEYLEKYANGDVFIESGTYRGDTVKLALKAGFNRVYSCELNDELFVYCRDLFINQPNVRILKGDSVDVFGPILSEVTGPATFWLDAHASGPLVGGKSGGCPILDELRIIAQHECKEHTIFMDDRRLFGSAEWSYVQEQEAMNLLMQINKNYTIHHLDGHVPGDVICATVRK